MRTYDLLMLLVLAAWWICFRTQYDWRAVVLFYLGGVMIADVFCAGLILLLYRRYPEILTTPALLMPVGGMVGLGHGVMKNRLSGRQHSSQTKKRTSLVTYPECQTFKSGFGATCWGGHSQCLP
jgi:hypothetical protein